MCSGSRRPKRSKASRSTTRPTSRRSSRAMVSDWTIRSPAGSSTSSSTISSAPPSRTTPSRRSCAAEFERARADAFLAQPRGVYAQVYLRRNFTIDDAAKRTRFQCAAFHLTRDGAKPQDGYLCVTSWNNKFVKLRLTTLGDSNTEAAARKYVTAWIPVLWGRAAAPAPSRSASRVRPAPQSAAQAPASGASPAPPRRPRVQMPGRLHLRSALRLSGRRRPHRADHVGDLVRIGHRQRAGLAHADERRARPVAAAILACAGWLAGNAPASGARSTIRLRYGSFSAAAAKRSCVRPGDDDLGGVQPQIERVEQRGMLQQVVGRRPPARRRTAGRPARAMRRRRSAPRAGPGSARRWHSDWAWRRRWSRPAAPPGPRRRRR